MNKTSKTDLYMKQSLLDCFFAPKPKPKVDQKAPVEDLKPEEPKVSLSTDSKLTNDISEDSHMQMENLTSSPLPVVDIEVPVECKIETVPNQTKSVYTPKWTKENVPAAPFEISSGFLCEQYRLLVNRHFEIEVIEYRIQEGEDLEHEHPAMAVDIHSKSGIYNFNKKELQHRNRYELKHEKNVVPLFWTNRVWDKDFLKLSELDTQKLKEEIDFADNSRKGMRKSTSRIHTKPTTYQSDSNESDYSVTLETSTSDGSSTESEDDEQINTQADEEKLDPVPLIQSRRMRKTMATRASAGPIITNAVCKFSSRLFDTDESEWATDWSDY